jgi:hypothetical protein
MPLTSMGAVRLLPADARQRWPHQDRGVQLRSDVTFAAVTGRVYQHLGQGEWMHDEPADGGQYLDGGVVQCSPPAWRFHSLTPASA